MEARARQRPMIGLYQTQAKPMTSRLMDIETDHVSDSMAIIPQSTLELRIIVLKMLARQVAARNNTSQPKPL